MPPLNTDTHLYPHMYEKQTHTHRPAHREAHITQELAEMGRREQETESETPRMGDERK